MTWPRNLRPPASSRQDGAWGNVGKGTSGGGGANGCVRSRRVSTTSTTAILALRARRSQARAACERPGRSARVWRVCSRGGAHSQAACSSDALLRRARAACAPRRAHWRAARRRGARDANGAASDLDGRVVAAAEADAHEEALGLGRRGERGLQDGHAREAQGEQVQRAWCKRPRTSETTACSRAETSLL